jgi:hypothetical protein
MQKRGRERKWYEKNDLPRMASRTKCNELRVVLEQVKGKEISGAAGSPSDWLKADVRKRSRGALFVSDLRIGGRRSASRSKICEESKSDNWVAKTM